MHTFFVLEDKSSDPTPDKSSSPGPPEPSADRRETPTHPVSDSSYTKPGTPSSFLLPHSTYSSTVACEPEELSTVSTDVARAPIPEEDEPLPEAIQNLTASSPPPGKAVNGLSESPPPSPVCEQEKQAQEDPLVSPQLSTLTQTEAPASEVIQEEPAAPVTQISISPTILIPSNAMSPLAPPPGLPVLMQPPSIDGHEKVKACGSNDVQLKTETTSQSSDGLIGSHDLTNSRKTAMAEGTV